MAWLEGKPAKEFKATKVPWGSTNKAKLYRFENAERWVPHSVCKFIVSKKSQEQLDRGVHEGEITGVLLIHSWFYDKMIKTKVWTK